MLKNNEISALFQLIDDPDEEVFLSVSERIVSFGRAIIPNLESLWENTADEAMQNRIEMIIHRLHLRDLAEEFRKWKSGNADLLQGALLVSQYCYPEMSSSQTLREVEKIRRNIWLELNSYLTPLEQTNVMSGILYSYYKLQGNEISYEIPDDFLIYKLVENKRGNPVSNGMLYLILCEMLDVPVKAIQIPGQFVLGYFSIQYKYPDPVKQNNEKINFFIDPLNGQVYSHNAVDNYFQRMGIHQSSAHYKPLDNIQVINGLLTELSKCYNGEINQYKREDLIFLSKMLSE